MVNKCPQCYRVLYENSSNFCSNCKIKSNNAKTKIKKINSIALQIQSVINSMSSLFECDQIKTTLRKSYSECQQKINKLKKDVIEESSLSPTQQRWNDILNSVKESAAKLEDSYNTNLNN